MASIIVRGLDPEVKNRLAAQAKANGRSMESEARDILTRATRKPNAVMALYEAVQDVGGIETLELPSREDEARAADFT